MKSAMTVLCAFAALGGISVGHAAPISTAFNFQGRLEKAGVAVTDTCDCRFGLFEDAGGAVQVGATQTINGVPIVDGLFTVELNGGDEFGPTAFNGDERFLEIAVQCPGDGGFTSLSPLQPINAAPYAHFALNGGGGVGDGHSLDAADGNPVDALFVDNDGNVGIGSLSPLSKLHVSGGTGSVNLFLEADTDNITESDQPSINMSQDGGNITADLGFFDTANDIHLRTNGDAALTSDIVLLPDGNVGIGETNPNAKLDVVGTTQLNGDVTINSNLTVDTDALFVDGTAGEVGIGTTTPATPLHVDGGTDVEPGSGGYLVLGDTAGANITLDSNELMARDNGATATLLLNRNGGDIVLNALAAGNVGIGNSSPTSPLTFQIADGRKMTFFENPANGNYGVSVNGGNLKLHAGDGDSFAGHVSFGIAQSDDTYTEHMRVTSAGRVGIGTASPVSELQVNGETTTDLLTIVGGADVAEPFDVAGGAAVRPGMVVAIDPAEVGKLRIAERAYDDTVAGIVSGAGGIDAGMVLGQKGTVADGAHPVALTGRVWCLCDADANGSIRAGNMLTTSNTPGHAMKATDRDRAFGATIGKAMSSLESGRGLVLVLVNLQ